MDKFGASISKWTVGLVAFSIFAQILWIRPFYGLMDDHTNFYHLYPAVLQNGLWAETLAFLARDLDWGMYRVTYIPMLSGLHWFAAQFGPIGFYLANFFFCAAIYFLAAWVWARILGLSLWAILLVIAAFFYSYDLFQYPSLQEKLLHIFGAPLFWFSWRISPGLFWRTILVIFFTLGGVFSKSSFFIYVSMAWLAFVYSLWEPLRQKQKSAICSADILANASLPSSSPVPQYRSTAHGSPQSDASPGKDISRAAAILSLAIVTAIDVALFLFIARVSKHGAYTSGGYSLARFLGNLFSPEAILLFGPALVLFFLVFRRREFRANPTVLLPAVGVLAYLALFLPWGIGAYLLTIITPAYAALLVLVLERISPEFLRRAGYLGLVVLALVFGIYRPYSMFHRLRDVGELAIRGPEWKAAGIDHLTMPCMEGADGMTKYFKNHGGVDIKARYSLEKPKAGEAEWFLYDTGLCTMPWARGGDSGCQESESLYTSGAPRWGFRLVKIQCASAGGV